jgi:type IV pilus assembly protein PilC
MARSLGVFLHSGVPVLGALEATKNILNSRSMEKGFEKATKNIMNGKSLTEAFEEERLFEPMVYGLMRVGEATGALDEMLKKLAQIYDREVDFGLGKLVALLEPTLILLIGGIVGVIIIAFAGPILSMSQTIG